MQTDQTEQQKKYRALQEEKTNLEDSLLTKKNIKEKEPSIQSFQDVKNVMRTKVKPLSTLFEERTPDKKESSTPSRINSKSDDDFENIVIGYETQIQNIKKMHQEEVNQLKEETNRVRAEVLDKEAEILGYQKEVEEIRMQANADAMLFNQRIEDILQEQTIMRNELSINKDTMEKLKQSHERELIKINLEKLDEIEKFKTENQELIEDKNKLNDQKFALEERI